MFRKMSVPVILVLVLGTGMVILPFQAGAQEIVAPLYQVVSPVRENPKSDGVVVRSAAVRLASDLFALGAKTDRVPLCFPTFSGDVFGKVSWEREHGSGTFSVAGALTGEDSGHFILTVHAGNATVSVHDAKRGWLRVSNSPEGYVLEEIDETARPECGACRHPEAFRVSGGQPAAIPGKADKEDPAIIDVMVVYTPASRTLAGSPAAMETMILNAADMANLSYANSAIPLTLNVAHIAEVDYVEDYQLALALAKLTFDNDGVMDEVHDLRDVHEADMVSLIASGGDVAGIGWILTALDATMAQRAFSITTYYSLGSLTFPHELGHNMGCDHDQENITADGYRLFSYARGWRFYGAEDSKLYRTVMSYAPGTRIPFFSNPDINYKGTPTGVPVGDPDEAHCALAITQSAPYLALNRPQIAEGETEGEAPVVYDGYYCELLGGIYTNELLRSLLPPFAIALFDLLDPETADLNGGADPETMTFYGNGMLDCGYELGVFRRILDTETLDLSSTGGVQYEQVYEANRNNRLQLVSDIGASNAAIVNGIAPGLLEVAAVYITLGDEGSTGFIVGLMDIINEVQYVGDLNLALYARLPEFLSAEGDADGDGATNREEYEAYYQYGPDAYVTYALNPAVFPGNTGSGQALILGSQKVKEGDAVTLSAFLSYMVGTVTIAWYKDGVVLEGQTSTEYHISSVTPEDAGEYKLLVTDESKGLYESPPFLLEVIAEASMPVSSIVTLGLLTLVLPWLGGWRRKPTRQ